MDDHNEENNDFARKAAKSTFLLYESIGKKGKPQKGREWALLASFLKTEDSRAEPEVICLATGSKCIGKSQRTNDGGKINDSHAEVLARRQLLRYFYDQLGKAATKKNSIFTFNCEHQRFSLKPGIHFHLFTSHTPCVILSKEEILLKDEEEILLDDDEDVDDPMLDDILLLKLNAVFRLVAGVYSGDASIFPKVEKDSNEGNCKGDVFQKEEININQGIFVKQKNAAAEKEKSIDPCSKKLSLKRNSQRMSPNGDMLFFKKSKNSEILATIEQEKSITDEENLEEGTSEKPCITQTAGLGCHNSSIQKQTIDEKRNVINGESSKTVHFQMQIEESSSNSEAENVTDYKDVSVNTGSTDIHRTGAKCVPSGNQDQYLQGLDYHVVGTLRTKPGRGERTLSMSCSDKIMKWCTLGLQGGLLSNILESPIYMSSIVIGKCPFNKDALIRGLSLRGRTIAFSSSSYFHRLPEVHYYDAEEFVDSKHKVECDFDQRKNFGKISASGAAILYCKEPFIHEVIVNGLKQGTTKKHSSTSNSQCAVSKSNLFSQYKSLLRILEANSDSQNIDTEKNYRNSKLGDQTYQSARESFFKAFPDWIRKPTEQELFF